MSDLERPPSQTVTPPDGHASVTPLFGVPGSQDGPPAPELPRTRTKIRWLRLVALLAGLGMLAGVSTVFGMMMAVASDLPALDVFAVDEKAPSRIYDRSGKRVLGQLTSSERRILVDADEIAPVMKQAVIAIEDKRFNEHSGVDFRGIARALYHDVVARKAVQGGSTITQQLVKNRLEAQNDRTVLQKLRESAIAFHMTRKWDKPRILTNYLNTIYFGNGAYGIEAAAKTYFGSKHVGCGEKGQRGCAEQLEPHEAALLAAVIASPTGYDPLANPDAARRRRAVVLANMAEQGYITPAQMRVSAAEPLPTKVDVQPPREESRFPYFTSWVRQQVVDQVGAGAAFEGGLKVNTTIDADLQTAAEASVKDFLGTNEAPAAAMVALDNRTSEVLAMVGGPLTPDAYNERPFNLATQGQRQPGSAFKPFILAEALRQGIGPNSTWTSKKKYFCVTRRKGKCREWFEVNNYEDRYAGVTNLTQATAFSDNAVYAELGLKLGTKKIAKLARRMGIRTKISNNPAITLGGLREGVTVLDMAHAYTTFANKGRLPYGTLSPRGGEPGSAPGPVGIRRIAEPDGDPVETLEGDEAVNERKARKILSEGAAKQAEGMLAGVVKYGTGKRAELGPDVFEAGKTGTTEDYGDAWFVGWTPRYTVAVWVGYPDEVKPMKPPLFSYQGDPVAGGTFPAAIWQAFMKRAEAIIERRNPDKDKDDDPKDGAPGIPPGTAPSQPQAPTPTPTTSGQGGGGQDPQAEAPAPDAPDAPPAEQQESPAQPQEPPAQPQTAPEGGAAPPPG